MRFFHSFRRRVRLILSACAAGDAAVPRGTAIARARASH
jgi:hypothetical protein